MNGMLRHFPGNEEVVNCWFGYDNYKVVDSILLAAKIQKSQGQAVTSRQRNLEFYSFFKKEKKVAGGRIN